MRFRLLFCLFAFTAPVHAQTVDCSNAASQAQINSCGAQAYEAADGDLNLAWGLAMAAAKAQDEFLEDGDVPSAKMLRNAQRSWITYRDQACEAESTMARGGSMQPMIALFCLERLTRTRTEDLRLFGETN